MSIASPFKPTVFVSHPRLTVNRQPPRMLPLLLLCACVAQGAAAADAAKAGHPQLTASQIVDRYIAARGGTKAWRAVKAMQWSGRMDAGSGDSAQRSAHYVQNSANPGSKKARTEASIAAARPVEAQQVTLPFTLSLERPRKSRLELQFAGQTAVQVYDGSSGWKVRPFLNRNQAEPFNAQEARSAASQPELDGPLMDYAAQGTKIELEGVDPVDGHDAYRLKVIARDGEARHIWIDTGSYLDVQVEGNRRQMDGRMRDVMVHQRDFRSVQGLMIPFVLETDVDGYRDGHRILIEKVTLNPKLDDALFGKPRV